MFRLAAPLIGALCVLAACTSPASAATLAVSAPDQQQPALPFADVSGTADSTSTVQVYGEVGGTSCGTTAQNHFEGRSIGFVATADVAPGPFALRATQAGGGAQTGTYRLCSYLVRGGSSQVDATAEGTLRYLAPACPGSAFTLAGFQDTGDGGASVATTVPGPGRLIATGDGGGTGAAVSGAAGPVALVVRPGNAGQAALMSGIPVTETFTVTYTQQHLSACADASGATVNTTSESRTIAVSFKATGKDVDGGDDVKRPTWLRAVGGADLLNLFGRPGVVNQIGPVCDAGCEDVSATMTIRVTAATQKRHRLPSRIIARSGAFKKRGEAVLADLVATKAMIARLKKAKVRKLTTTVTFDARRPIDETVTKKQVFHVGRRLKSVTYRRFCMGTAKDRLCGKAAR